MGLTSEKTLRHIQTLFDMFFQMNAKMDRQVYVLDIKFNCPKLQEFWHKVSHQFPLLADKVQDFGSLRGDLFYRGALNTEDKDYSKISDLFYDFVIYISEIEKWCDKCIDIAIENNDKMYEDFLRDFGINTLAVYSKQAIVLYKMAIEYEKNGAEYKINKDYKDWLIGAFKKGGVAYGEN